MYVWTVGLAGLAVTVRALVLAESSWLGAHRFLPLVIGVLLVAAELWPIPVPRGGQATDEITLSSTFGLALLFLGPLGVVLVVQATALVVETALRRRRWGKVPFNVAQYALSYLAAGVVYHELVETGTDGMPGPLRPLPALAAGLVFFVCNNGLIAGVLALRAERGILRQFIEDVRWQAVTAIPATALAPVITAAALWSPWLLLFLLTPLVAVYHSGQLASRREHEALHDPLTGLGNRAMLFAALDRTFAVRSGRHAVLLLDLDHFKDVNDTLGHQVGDALLVTAAELLSSLVPDGSTVARLGGDEFAVLLRDAGRDEAVALAGALTRGLRQPRVVEGISLRARGSIGIAFYPQDGLTRAELLRRADVALYKAKEERDGFVLYQPGYDRAALDQLKLANELAAVLEDPAAAADQLVLVFQPLVAATTGFLDGVECLVRWSHPRLGLLVPSEFLPLAEHAGLINALGRHVLECAVAQQLAWARTGLVLRVSVNVSVAQLSDTTLPETVAQVLARYGVKPGSLVLEVTEDGLMSDPERSSEILRRIRATGAQLSIDDYGSGYSSLAYVKQLEVDELKIDRTFVAGVRHDSTDRIIVQSTIDLAHALGLRVVAEGIEDMGTARLLDEMGCDVLQGYALGRPGPADDIAGSRVGGWPEQGVPVTLRKLRSVVS